MSDKRTTTIELTPEDERCLEIIKASIGAESIIAAIRYALRETSEGLELDAARLARARVATTGECDIHEDDLCKCGNVKTDWRSRCDDCNAQGDLVAVDDGCP